MGDTARQGSLVMAAYIPEQGDLVILTFNPQAGHEPMGRRPPIVVSVTPFNRGTGLAICCPITNTMRNTPFHIPVPDDSGLTGFVICEQMKSVDYNAWNIQRVGQASEDFLNEVLAILDSCLF